MGVTLLRPPARSEHASGTTRGRRALLGTVLFVGFTGVLAATVGIYIVEFGARPDDAQTYLAAAERLNAGHDLYRLVPGDRPIPRELMGPIGDVPLLSPPLVAAIWRPIALLPSEAAIWMWWTAMLACVVACLLVQVRGDPVVAGLTVGLTTVPLIWQITGGNVNAVIIAGASASWMLARASRMRSAGLVLGALVVLKLTPVVLAVWLLAIGGRQALQGLIGGLGVAMAVALVAAGMDAHTAYVRVLAELASSPTAYSAGGILAALGAPADVAAVASPLLVGLACLAVVGSRRTRGLSFTIATVAMVVGFAAVQVHTFAMLAIVGTAAAWPARGPLVASRQLRAIPSFP